MTRARGRAPLYALIGANAVSLLGNVVASIAIPWFALVITGSAAKTGLAAFAATAPLVAGAFFGGPVADRIGARRASVLADWASALAVAGIPLLHAAGALEYWSLLTLAFVGALFDAPGQAARQALVPELAQRGGTPLERANSLLKGSEHVAYVLGAPLAGGLIAALGAPAALWVDAASFASSAAAVALGVPALPPAAAAGATYVQELLEGVRFTLRDPVVRVFLVVPALGNFLISPLAPVVLPIYAHQELGGARTLGVLLGAYGAGGLLGTVAFGLAGPRLPRRRVYVALWLGYALVTIPLALLPPLGPLLAVLALIGFAAGAIGPLEHTIRQERTPPGLLVRVLATVAAAEALAIPFGVLVAGFLIEALGLAPSLVLFAAGNAVLAVGAIAARGARRLDRGTSFG